MTYEEATKISKEVQKKRRRKKIFKTLLLCTACGVGGYAIGRSITKATVRAIEKEAHRFKGADILTSLKSDNQYAPWVKKIDEDIFTNLAPEMEEAILNYGLEKFWAERTYELDPVTSKLVTVSIETINGD